MKKLSLSEFADKIGEIMPDINREFVRQQTNEFYKIRITFPQFIVLEFLHRSGESNMTDLATFINVTTAAVTGIVDRLVRDGYVKRKEDPDDRRVVNIQLTSKGDKVVSATIKCRKNIVIKMLGAVSQKEREDYLRILTNMRDRMKDTGGVAAS